MAQGFKKLKHSILTIKRPSGDIETVDVTKPEGILTEKRVAQIRAAMKKANKGEVIGFDVEFYYPELIISDSQQYEIDVLTKYQNEKNAVEAMSRMGE